jgi:predicted nucleic acid-binding protein
MTASVFVDTNILVYWRDSSDAAKQTRATEWLDTLWRERRGRTSTQVLAEYYSAVTRKQRVRMASEDAWRDVQALVSWNPCPVTVDLLNRARVIEHKYRLSWWDSQIVAAAQAQGCALLLTEDLQDGANYDGVVARNPFVLGVSEERTAYAPAPKSTSRYRGRGRPRTRPQRSTPTGSAP